MENKKKTFFEKLTGTAHTEEEQEEVISKNVTRLEKKSNNWIEEENDEAELTVDVHQTSKDIMIQAMVAGVKPENLELIIARDMVTIRGKRGENRHVNNCVRYRSSISTRDHRDRNGVWVGREEIQ